MSENNKVDIKKIDVIKDFNIQNDEEKILFDSSLDFEPLTMFGGLVERRPWFKNHQLSIEPEGEIDKDIVFDESEKLVFIRLKNHTDQNDRSKFEFKKGALIEDFYINNYSFPYSVLLNPKAFKDYKNLDNDRVTLKLKVVNQLDKDYNPFDKHLIELNYQLTKYNPIPEARFILDESFDNGFEYKKDRHKLLGLLEIENASNYIYTYDLAFKVRVASKDNGNSLIYTFGDLNEYEQTNPQYYNTNNGLRTSEETVYPILKTTLIADNILEVEGHNAKNILRVPVFIDLDKLQNPIEESIHNVLFSFEYTINHNTNYQSIETSFKLLKDTRTTALMTFLKLDSRYDMLTNHTYNTKSKFQWRDNFNGRTNCFSIRLGNFAENANDSQQGAVRIDNLKITFEKDSSSPSDIELLGLDSLNNVFDVTNYDSKNFVFPDKANSYLDFDVRFPHSLIKDIPNDRLFINCVLSFDYTIDKNYNKDIKFLPSDTEMKHFETNIFFEMEKYPGPYWLAVDLGTAAIVAAGSGGGNQNVSVNLQDSLLSYLKTKGLHINYEQDNVPEYNSSFLSSTLMFIDGGEFNAESSDEEVLALSPLKNEINHRRLLPYIKSLIGTETIPNFNGLYDEFSYLDENGVGKTFKDSPIETKKIVTSAYDLLFKYFVIPQIKITGLSDDLNKLILTVPNSFTPRHISEIRNIIHSKHPGFKQQYLTFLTESDAVASFYLKKWNDLNKDRSEVEINSLTSNGEYTLVYDMGAGTLDLTYFSIKTTANNEKEVNIIARLGSTIAGNYLDYVMAKWIYNTYQEDFTHNVLEPKTSDALIAALEFKSFIQEKIKPEMSASNNEFPLKGKFIKDQDGIEIDILEFFSSKSFEDYLLKSSDKILKNLFSLAFPQRALENNIRVDTVIFSGRGVQTYKLKDKVKSSIQKIVVNDNFHPVDLIGDDLKRAVVDGALQYALLYKQKGSIVSFKANNLQAKYGVLYRNPANSRWAFKELLNPTTKSTSKDPKYVDGNMIYEYDTDIHCAEDINGYKATRPLTVDFSATDTGYFIQTFSLDPAKDANEGNFEFISKMISLPRSYFNSNQIRKLPIRVVVTEINSMQIYYGDYQNDDTDPLVVNPEGDEAFIRSMWPLIV